MIKDTKENIIEEAFRLFQTNSYEAVSISDICTEIGFTKGALYHHFKNKEELFKAVVDKYFILFDFEINIETITLKEYNELLINNVYKIFKSVCGESNEINPIDFMSLIVDSFRHYQGFDEKTLRLMNLKMNKTKKMFENAIKRGEIRSDINCLYMSEMYFTIYNSLAGNLLRNSSIDKAINRLKNQLNEFYKLLKI